MSNFQVYATSAGEESVLDFFCVYYAATQLGLQVQQARERTQMVSGSKEARKRLTDSNSTPTMDLGHWHRNLNHPELVHTLKC